MVGDHRETIEVPAYINTGLITTSTTMMRHIVGISYDAFKGHSHIKRLTISPDCIYFKDRCFSGCTGLVDLQINPAEMGDGVFEGCTHLTTIGKEAFSGCSQMMISSIPMQVETVPLPTAHRSHPSAQHGLTYSTQMGKDVYLHDDMLFHKPMPKK